MIVRNLRFTVNGQVSVTTVNPRPPHKIYKFSRHDPPRSVEEKERKGAFPCSTLERKRIISGERPRLAATQACLNVHAGGNMVQELELVLCAPLLYALRDSDYDFTRAWAISRSEYMWCSESYIHVSSDKNLPFSLRVISHSAT